MRNKKFEATYYARNFMYVKFNGSHKNYFLLKNKSLNLCLANYPTYPKELYTKYLIRLPKYYFIIPAAVVTSTTTTTTTTSPV